MLSVVIPVFNEEEVLERSVEKLINYLSSKSRPFEVIAVDNGSVDKTSSIGKYLSEKHSCFHFLQIAERGVGRAFVHGVRHAQYEKIVAIDADLSSELIFIDYAEELLELSHMVVGSKTLGYQKRSFLRIMGSQLYILIVQFLFKLTVTDYSPDSKAYKRSEILPILDHIDLWTGFVFEISLYLRLKNRRVVQVGVDCDDNRVSHFNVWHEAVYRYSHLYRCWKLLKNPQSWIHGSLSGR